MLPCYLLTTLTSLAFISRKRCEKQRTQSWEAGEKNVFATEDSMCEGKKEDILVLEKWARGAHTCFDTECGNGSHPTRKSIQLTGFFTSTLSSWSCIQPAPGLSQQEPSATWKWSTLVQKLRISRWQEQILKPSVRLHATTQATCPWSQSWPQVSLSCDSITSLISPCLHDISGNWVLSRPCFQLRKQSLRQRMAWSVGAQVTT